MQSFEIWMSLEFLGARTKNHWTLEHPAGRPATEPNLEGMGEALVQDSAKDKPYCS